MVQAHIVYSGMVQGVGFRYTAHRYATTIGLVGWVRNLSDGRVEMVVEGKQQDVEQLMVNIEHQFDGYIKEKKLDYSDTQQHFQGFRITH